MNIINLVDNEIYILDSSNINLFLNNSYILEKNNILNSKSIPSDAKSNHEFCTFLRLKQLMKVPARTATSISTIIDHVLARYLERVTQCRVIDISLSAHDVIYCLRKVSRITRVSHKQIQFSLFKHHTVNLSEKELAKLNFPNYQSYNRINEAYDFIEKIINIADKVLHIKGVQVF